MNGSIDIPVIGFMSDFCNVLKVTFSCVKITIQRCAECIKWSVIQIYSIVLVPIALFISPGLEGIKLVIQLFPLIGLNFNVDHDIGR